MSSRRDEEGYSAVDYCFGIGMDEESSLESRVDGD
jgi:hypothetical protein